MKYFMAKYASKMLMTAGFVFAFTTTMMTHKPKPPAEFLKK